ncbi:MAG TPA: acyltransferase [Flavisolibacter sp.]|jgi:peptidoglycan/LPS O-acetylase OafA/YrhL|nr:acyltransferase [Flavisolibacter sp.]
MKGCKPDSSLFQSKEHFYLLDGLRGVAALCIVIFHFMEWIFPDLSSNFIGHGFLAVDFFFCLSGFVIGYAYDDRIRLLGIKEFFKARLIRLHPLVVFGTLAGFAAYLLDPFAASSSYHAGILALLLISSLFLIPLPIMAERANNLFAFNAPAWSLFWEYVANIVYALVLYKLGRRTLGILVLIAAAGLCLVSYRSGNLLGGWSKATFLDGGVRVSYSFLAGLYIYRSDWILKNRLGFAGLSILLVIAFLMPGSRWNWLTELFVVLFYFPLLVSLGAGAALSPVFKKTCRISGDLSYPLYMSHYCVLWIYGNYFTSRKPSSTELTIVIVTSILVLLLFAYLVMRFYDKPIRKYLNRKRWKREASNENVPIHEKSH